MNTAVAGLVTGLALGFAGFFGGFGALVVVAVMGAVGVTVGCLVRGDVRFSDFRFARQGHGAHDGAGPGRNNYYRTEGRPGPGSGWNGPRPRAERGDRVR
jgi:hypothetical protein